MNKKTLNGTLIAIESGTYETNFIAEILLKLCKI